MKYTILLLLMKWISIASLMAYQNEAFNPEIISDRTLRDIEKRTSFTTDPPSSNLLRGDFDEGPPTEGGGTGGPVGVIIGEGLLPFISSVLVYFFFLLRKKGRIRSVNL